MQGFSSCPVCLSSPALPLPHPFCKAAEVCFCLFANTHYMSGNDEIRIAADLLWSVMHSVLEMIRQCQWSTVACKVPKGAGRQTKLQGDIRRLYDLRERRGTSTAYIRLHGSCEASNWETFWVRAPGEQHLMGAVLSLVKVMLQVSTSGLCPVISPFSLLAYLLQPALALCFRHAHRC